MNKKKIIPIALQMPMILVMIAALPVSIYATVKKIGGIEFPVPIIFGIIIFLYFYGRYLENKYKKEYF